MLDFFMCYFQMKLDCYSCEGSKSLYTLLLQKKASECGGALCELQLRSMQYQANESRMIGRQLKWFCERAFLSKYALTWSQKNGRQLTRGVLLCWLSHPGHARAHPKQVQHCRDRWLPQFALSPSIEHSQLVVASIALQGQVADTVCLTTINRAFSTSTGIHIFYFTPTLLRQQEVLFKCGAHNITLTPA